MKLYELRDEYFQILQALDDIPDLTPEIIADTLSDCKHSIEEKAINVGAYIKNLEAEEHKIKCHLTVMQDRHKKLGGKIESLKGYLHDNLISMKIDAIHDPFLDIKIKKNPPSVLINDEMSIDEKYFSIKQTRSLDKGVILDDLKAGEIVRGCSLLQKTRVEIK